LADKHVTAYLDLAFFGTLFVHLVILWATAKFAQIPVRWNRILVSSIFAALYSLTIFFPNLSPLITVISKLIFSILIVVIAFGFMRLRPMLRTIGYFYAVSFALGGAVYGSIYFFKTNPKAVYTFSGVLGVIGNHLIYGIIIALILVVILAKWGSAFFRKKFVQNFFKVPLILIFDKERLKVSALIDTGNQLRDPITQIPVIVVEFQAIKELLPQEIKEIFLANSDPDLLQFMGSITKSRWSTRFRAIPYASLGKHNGMLIGFRPDEIIIAQGDSMIRTRNVIVGIYNKELCSDGSYQALLHPELLNIAA
jgi:stage II sporulation protein GA (sporulation sigma-E factor processing peptidase)